MRGLRRGTPGLATPHRLGTLLPSLYDSDELAQDFTAGLDEILAPVLCVLDCLDAYVDPWVAPKDFVPWLESCVGIEPDENVPIERRRVVLQGAARAYRMHGTAAGVRAAVRALTGVVPVVVDTGGVSLSTTPGTQPRPIAAPRVLVYVPEGSAVDLRAVDAAVDAIKPAHVRHRVVMKGVAR